MAKTRKILEIQVAGNKFFGGFKRTSFRFNNGCKDDDDHVYVGKFRILKIKSVVITKYRKSFGEADGRIYTVLASKVASKADVISTLEDSFTYGCRCEHDCCGHLVSRVDSIRRTKRRQWLVECGRSYNV